MIFIGTAKQFRQRVKDANEQIDRDTTLEKIEIRKNDFIHDIYYKLFRQLEFLWGTGDPRGCPVKPYGYLYGDAYLAIFPKMEEKILELLDIEKKYMKNLGIIEEHNKLNGVESPTE